MLMFLNNHLVYMSFMQIYDNIHIKRDEIKMEDRNRVRRKTLKEKKAADS